MSDLSNVQSDFELDLISLLVNFACELMQIMTRYDFLWARWVILSNVQTDSNLTLFLSTFNVNWKSHIWPFRLNITFGWLRKVMKFILSEFVCEVSAMFNSLMPSLNNRSLPFVIFLGGFPSRCQNLTSGAIRPGGLLSYELEQIMTRYDILWARWMILSNVRTDFNIFNMT